MKKIVLVLLSILLIFLFLFGCAEQSKEKTNIVNNLENVCWVKTFGGHKLDAANSVQQTTDGGYIIAGWTDSKGMSPSDVWILKLDSAGELEWDKTFGGDGIDTANSVQQTTDGGYIIAGWTDSKGAGDNDAWVLKLNSNGNLEWDKTFGGSDDDAANAIQQTTEGGYIIGGKTVSKGAGNLDAWIFKLDKEGNLEWDKSFGGSSYDTANSIQQTTDAGYIVAGMTDSKETEKTIWIFKLDSNGNVVWDNTFGQNRWDVANLIQQTKDEGYIVAGNTNSQSTKNYDILVLKLDQNGNVAWDKTVAGSGNDEAKSIQQTTDGGYILVGGARFVPSKSVPLYGAQIIKLDSTGNVEWEKNYGKEDLDLANSIQQTIDGGYIVAGQTGSKSIGDYDIWILKLDIKGNLECG